MDIEKARRAELIESLRAHFDCYEEVSLSHAILEDLRIRADVIAVPRSKDFDGMVFAFEVKMPSGEWGYSEWCDSLKQAHDYVYAKVFDKRFPDLNGRLVGCSFLFPSPPYVPFSFEDGIATESPFIRKDDIVMVSGAFHLGLHFRVGRCYYDKESPWRRLVLAFGPNDVWNSMEGFVARGRGLLQGSRRVGSRKVNILKLMQL